jgi:pilus assembly protein CpaE
MMIVVEPDETLAAELVERTTSRTQLVAGVEQARTYLGQGSDVNVVLVGQSVDAEPAYKLAEQLRVTRPALSVILMRHRIDTHLLSEALRAGVREVVQTRDVTALTAAIGRADRLAGALRDRAARDDDNAGPHGRLVTIFSAKGGCGKTTVATNLAATLADKGRHNVCLVDLDLAFGDVAIALQIFPTHTIAETTQTVDELDAEVMASLLTTHSPGLSVLAAPVEPSTAETLPAATIGNVLHLARSMFDYVVVDTPPAFTDHVMVAFDQSDLIIVLATLDIPALKNLKVTMETLDLLGYPRDKWRVALNRADSKVGLEMNEVEESLSIESAVRIPSSRAVPSSVNRGVPLMLDEPDHPVSQAIRGFAEQHVVIAAAAADSVPTHLRQDRRMFLRRKVKA